MRCKLCKITTAKGHSTHHHCWKSSMHCQICHYMGYYKGGGGRK